MQPSSGRDTEAGLQRRLAKQLGLKSRRDALGGDDGLDDLLDGLDGLHSAGETSSEGGDGIEPHAEEEGTGSDSDGDNSEGWESDGDAGDLGLDADSDGETDDAQVPMNREHSNGSGRAGQDESDRLETGIGTDESAESVSATDDGESSMLTSAEESDGDLDDGGAEHVFAQRRQSGADATASGRPKAVQAGKRAVHADPSRT